MPPEYVGGLGTDGGDMLRQFVDAGGTLVALDSASELAMTLLRRADARTSTRGAVAERVFLPGSIVQLELDPDPLTYGRAAQTAGFCSFSTAFDVRGAIVGAGGRGRVDRSHRRPLRERATCCSAAGSKASRSSPAKARSWKWVGPGPRDAVCVPPQHRGQSHATFRLFFNAIHTSQLSRYSASDRAPRKRQ